MRALTLASALLVLPLAAPMAAQAQTPRLSDEFMAICAPNQAAPEKMIAAAKARGYQPVPYDVPAGMDSLTALIKSEGSRVFVTVVLVGRAPATSGEPAQAISACSLSGAEDESSLLTMRRWAGFSAADLAEPPANYFFIQRGDTRTKMASIDQASTVKALNEGGYALFQSQEGDGKLSVSLTTTRLLK